MMASAMAGFDTRMSRDQRLVQSDRHVLRCGLRTGDHDLGFGAVVQTTGADDHQRRHHHATGEGQ